MTEEIKNAQARKFLEENDGHFRDLFENANDIIYVHDLKGNYLLINQTAANVFGYSREEIASMNVNQIVVPELMPMIRRRLAEKREGRMANTVYEVDCIAKDGSRLTLEVNSRMITRDGIPFAIQGIARDITERIRTQKALRVSEERYRELYENANDLIYTHDLHGNFTSLNRAGELITGYTREEALKTNMVRIIAPECIETAREMTRRKLAGEHHAAYELKIVTKDGRGVWLELNTRLIKQGGKPVGVQGIGRDISERKRADAQTLTISEIIEGVSTTSNLDELLHHIHESLRKVLYAENCYVALYDKKTELLHIPFCRDQYDEAAPPQKLGKGLTAYVMRHGQPVLLSSDDIKVLMYQGDVELIGTPPAVWLGVPLRTPTEIVGVLVIQHYDDSGAYNERDLELLTAAGDQIALAIERKRASENLAEANQRAIREYDQLLQRLATFAQETGAARDLGTIFTAILKFAHESIPCAGLFISLYDPEQSVRRLIYFWYNGKEVDVSGFDPVPVRTGLVGQALASGEVKIANDYQSVTPRKSSYLHVGYDEDPREPRSSIIAPMKIMGKAIGVIEVQSYELNAYRQEHATAMRMAANLAATAIENVRLLEQERMRAEQLREAQKLESVGRLAGGIAHDFNNMLTAINGYSDLTLKRLPAEDPLRKNIVEIKKAGERSALLTQQLLAFSRRQMLQPRILDINHEVTEISTLLKRLIGEDIQLITDLAPIIGKVEADPGQLTQVLLNLAVNARDSIPAGGMISIETANVRLSKQPDVRGNISQDGEYVMIAVADNGEGMTQEVQEHIFEPFFTTKELGKGTGMGLATVYGIIKQSGGQITVQSELGEGTTFRIYLPVIEEAIDHSKAGHAVETSHNGSETILLVEDEDIVRNLSSAVLKACGYNVIEANHGMRALDLCRKPEVEFDMLVTDVVMPQLSGRQLAEEVIALRPETKVLYMSGYTDDEIFRQGIVKDGSNFIQKPFANDTLARTVREVLDARN
jgi:PAS domain S-box-containing protein